MNFMLALVPFPSKFHRGYAEGPKECKATNGILSQLNNSKIRKSKFFITRL